jgi:glycosyltransferase involved in cell wall biosynthesis
MAENSSSSAGRSLSNAVRRAGGERGLRFCMITTFYPPFHFGGDAIAIQRLARSLVRRGHHVTVVHNVDAYRLLSTDEPARTSFDDGVETIGLESRFPKLRLLAMHQLGRPIPDGGRLRDIVENGNYDVVHFHNVSLVGGPGVLAMGGGVKLYSAHEHWLVCPMHVLWRHGREPCTGKQCLRCSLHYRRPPQVWRHTGLLEREIRHVDAFIAKSEFSRAMHRDFEFPREMEVLPEFLPDDESPAVATRPHERPYFLFAGRLEQIKGLDDVIRAFRRFEGADLLVAGAGDHEPALRELARGHERVHFLGQRTPEELRAYFRHAVAAVVPSLCYETFGLVVIEAFREGIPAIVRRRGPLPEIVDRCGGGLTFDSNEELVAALTALATDEPERERLGTAARAGFVEFWSEDAVLPRYFEIIHDNAVRKGLRDIARKLAANERN